MLNDINFIKQNAASGNPNELFKPKVVFDFELNIYPITFAMKEMNKSAKRKQEKRTDFLFCIE